jgi:HK97 family phage major capsid protein
VLSDDDKEILNSMNEGADEDGGLTVPKDIRTAVKELRRSGDALETLVNVERVSTLSGSRVVERYADQTPFDNVDEAAEFPGISTPQFEKIEYKVKKKGGILKVTQELLSDTAENIIGYLKKWIAKKSKATRNFMIVAKIREITKDAEVTVEGLDDLKKVFNVLLDPAIALTAGVVTNQDGYNWLDTLKDKDGRYILQPDPTKPTSVLLFGKYPVNKVSNKTMPSVATEGGYKVPIVCGDLKEAITIFDRETLTIDISSSAGDLWNKDQTGIKVRERLDIQSVDEEAIIMAEHIIASDDGISAASLDDDEVKTYTQEELEAMTKAQILEVATQLGYNMTTTESNTKAEIVSDFLAQQTA